MPERSVLESMTHRQVVSVAPQATVHEAAALMTRHKCSSVLVIDAAQHLHGILTERDLVTRVVAKAMSPDKTAVSDVMTAHPNTIAPELKVADAVLMMIERGYRHLPVMGADGVVMGVFSARDALPREIGNAFELAEFVDSMNDARI